MKRESQNRKVLKHLIKYGIMAVMRRIYDLRKQGYAIDTVMTQSKSRSMTGSMTGSRYAVYSMGKKPNK